MGHFGIKGLGNCARSEGLCWYINGEQFGWKIEANKMKF